MKRKIKKIHIHHAALRSTILFTGKNHQNIVDEIRRWHVDERGWNDIGYHYVIFPDGIMMTGRPVEKKPASIKFHNRGAIAICLWGDYDVEIPEIQMLYSAGRLCTNIIENFNLNLKADIIFHREYSLKTCPGKNIRKNDFINITSQFQY